MRKRLLALLLTTTMLSSTISSSVLAQEDMSYLTQIAENVAEMEVESEVMDEIIADSEEILEEVSADVSIDSLLEESVREEGIEESDYDSFEETIGEMHNENLTELEESIEESSEQMDEDFSEELSVELPEEFPSDESIVPELPIEVEKSETVIEDEETAETFEGTTDTVTRLEWWMALEELFNMSVEENNYPDNYYTDVDFDDDYYYEIMLATEFGLVDVEAGDALRPNDPVTRQLAAENMNLCLAYQIEDPIYTFSEVDEVNDPLAVQIAIDRGWFTVTSGRFMPTAYITNVEKGAIISDAVEVLKKDAFEENHEDKYEFKEEIIILPIDVDIQMIEMDRFVITNLKTELKAGQKFAVMEGNLPIVRKAVKVEPAGEGILVTTESVALEDAFNVLDIQGSNDVSLADIQVLDSSVALNYIVGGTAENDWEDGCKYGSLAEVGEQEITCVEAVKTYDIPDNIKEEYDIADGVKATISCKVGKMKEKHKVDFWTVYASLSISTTVSFTCNVSMDVLEALGVSKNVTLLRVPVCGIGYMDITMDMVLKGEVTMSLEEDITVGVSAGLFEGFRLIKEFNKKAFTIQAQAEAKVGLTATAGVDVGFIKGSLYAKFGVQGKAKIHTYDDDKKPNCCAQVQLWVYATAGANVQVDIKIYKDKWETSCDIFTKSNSPIKVEQHYEDGEGVSFCTRDGSTGVGAGKGGTENKYYTPTTSKYSYNGSSTGYTAKNEPYTIFSYSLDADNNATITKYNGNVSALRIPEKIDGYKVIKIGSSVFSGKTQLRTVVICDSVTEIGEFAFRDCSNLVSVILPKQLKVLKQGAFSKCSSLNAIEIPKSLSTVTKGSFTNTTPFSGCNNLKNISFEIGTTKVVGGLFADCKGIENIVFPDTITSLEETAFADCTKLKKVIFSDSITYIGDSCFSNCISLEELELPKSLSSMGKLVFRNCTMLKKVWIPKNLTSVKEAYLAYYSVSYGALDSPLNNGGPFTDCSSLENVEFEKGITRIPSYLFAHCTGLKKVEVPDTVTYIGIQTFDNCTNLSEIDLHEGILTIDSAAFANAPISRIDLPNSVRSIRSYAFAQCKNLEYVKMPTNLQSLQGAAFALSTKLDNIVIPKGLKTVEPMYMGGYSSGDCLANAGPFGGCSGLKHVTIEEIQVLPSCLFAYCTGIEEIDIPESVQYIGAQCFDKCKNLKKVNLHEGLLGIESVAFCGCSSLEEIELPETVESMGVYVFDSCKNLTRAKLPATRVNITEGTFKNCSSLVNLEMGEEITYIRRYALYNTALETFVIPKKVVEIEEYGMAGCHSMTEIVFNDALTKIGNNAFTSCDSLKQLTLSNSVSEVGTYAFSWCAELEKIVLGNSMKSIPKGMFYECSTLKNVQIAYGIENINDAAFANCPNLLEIMIPRRTLNISSGAFSYPTKMKIYGVKGTSAEKWALDNEAIFVDVEKKALNVELKDSKIQIYKGKKTKVNVSISPVDFTDEVVWKSADTDIVTVSNTGEIQAVGVGETTVKVAVGSQVASCKVQVLQAVTRISLDLYSYSMEAMDEVQLTASVYPSTASNSKVLWTSSDPSVVAVNEQGLVTGLRKGTAVITATAGDNQGASSECKITVTNTVTQCLKVAELESPHDYNAKSSDSWVYSLKGASAIVVKFDSRTIFEEGSDWLYVYDTSNTLVGRYSGTELAGKQLTITGDTVKLKLVSDDTLNMWGFKVTSVKPDYGKLTGTVTIDGTANYGKTLKATVSNTNNSGTLSYQWMRDGVKISTATAASYKIVKTDIGKKITCIVSSNHEEGTLTSNALKIILPIPTVSLTKDTSAVYVSWTTIPGATGYIVYRKTDGGSYEKLADITGGTTSNYKDSSVKNGTIYTYAVKASTGSVTSGHEGTTITFGILAPKVTLTNTDQSVKITWNAVEDAEGYKVYRKEVDGKYELLKNITVPTTKAFTDKTVLGGKTYTYAVRAYAGTLNSAINGVDIKLPVFSTTVTAKTVSAGVSLSWIKSAGSDGYKVYRKDASGKYSLIATVVGESKLTYGDKTALGGKSYGYAVKAYIGNRVSAIAETTIKVPVRATTLTLSNEADGVHLKWIASKGADGYKIYRKLEGGKYTVIKEVTGENNLTYVDADASVGKTYVYAIRAYVGSSLSDFKDVTINVTVRETIAKATKEAEGVKLTWSVSHGAEGYRIYRKEEGGKYSLISTVTGENKLTYIDSNIQLGKTYVYAVRAYFGTTLSNFTAVTVKITAKVAPVTLSNTASGVKLSWTAVTNAVSYRIYKKTADGAWTKVTDVTGTSYTDKEVSSGKNYTYSVCGIVKDGTPTKSQYETAGKSIKYISAPVLSKVEKEATGVHVYWGTIAGRGLYRVFRKEADGSFVAIGDTTSTDYLDTKVANGKTYTYTVKCVTKDGSKVESAYDKTGLTITFTLPPIAPTAFKVVGVIGGRNVTFTSEDKDAVIYYSTTTSNLTTKDKKVANGGTVLFTNYYGTLYAKAYKDGRWSNVSRLILKIPVVNTPTITALGAGKVKITTTTPSCQIYYTIDGTTPSPTNGKKISASNAEVYVGAGKTVKAIAVRSCFTNSNVATGKSN